MTRYTNIGIKRTYVQAGFDDVQDQNGIGSTSALTTEVLNSKDGENQAKKKRKRSKKNKTEMNNDLGEGSSQQQGSSTQNRKDGEEKKAVGWGRDKNISYRAAKSEKRRLDRIREKSQNTICFACRERGHAARDCPKTLGDTKVALDSDEEGGSDGKAKAVKAAVGICYRCGSTRHTLSRCRKPANPDNPLPFASCFVCSRKGHLASSCPQNADRGVYPNGGSCKLCGEKSHLAKNCPLRKQEQNPSTLLLSSGRHTRTHYSQPTADEDDFHTFKRINAEVDREEKYESRVKKRENAAVGVGAVSGKVVRVNTSSKASTGGAKKVVYF